MSDTSNTQEIVSTLERVIQIDPRAITVATFGDISQQLDVLYAQAEADQDAETMNRIVAIYERGQQLVNVNAQVTDALVASAEALRLTSRELELLGQQHEDLIDDIISCNTDNPHVETLYSAAYEAGQESGGDWDTEYMDEVLDETLANSLAEIFEVEMNETSGFIAFILNGEHMTDARRATLRALIADTAAAEKVERERRIAEMKAWREQQQAAAAARGGTLPVEEA